MPNPSRAISAAATGLVLAIYLALAWAFRFSIDAAWVDARFARNLVRGLGPAFNPGGVPVEAWSSPVSVLAGAVAEAVGLPALIGAQVVGVVCGGLLLLLLRASLVDRLGVREVVAVPAVSALAAAPMVVAWSTGMPGMLPGVLALAWAFDRVVLAAPPRGAALAVAVLVLARHDGFAWAALFLVLGAAARVTRRAASERPLPRSVRRGPWVELRPLGDAALALVVVAGALTAARLAVFGAPIPWTLARHGLDPVSGLAYLLASGVGAGLPLTWLAVAHPTARTGRWAPVAIALGVALAGAVLWGGEGEPFARLLLPALPFGLFAFARVVDHQVNQGRVGTAASALLIAAALGHLPAWDVPLAPKRLRDAAELRPETARVRTELDQWRFTRSGIDDAVVLSRAVAAAVGPDASWTVGSPGVRGYVSDLRIVDLSGATDPAARRAARTEARPTVLRARVLHDRLEAEVLADAWRESETGYVAQITELDQGSWLVLHRRQSW